MHTTNRKDITKEQEAIYAELNHRAREIQVGLNGIIELLHRPSDLPAESEIKVLNHLFAEIELQANHISETIVPESGTVFDSLSASRRIIKDTEGTLALLIALNHMNLADSTREEAETIGKAIAASVLSENPDEARYVAGSTKPTGFGAQLIDVSGMTEAEATEATEKARLESEKQLKRLAEGGKG
jgi:hypothetical protein